jgi:ABC-type lipopolysaccharide export system ATPase subunit
LIAEGSPTDIVRNSKVVEAYLGQKFAERFGGEVTHG